MNDPTTPPDVEALAKVGERLRSWRKFFGLSAGELAERTTAEEVPVGPQTVYDYETGRTQPNAAGLASLCKALGITVAQLLGPTPAERMEAERETLAAGR